jgi:hypothetical protein
MIKKTFAFLIALNLAFVPLVYAQNQQGSSSSSGTASGSASGAGASSAAGAATAGVTAGIVGAAAAALAVAAAISSSKADPVYTYSNTGQTWGTVTICIANC